MTAEETIETEELFGQRVDDTTVNFELCAGVSPRLLLGGRKGSVKGDTGDSLPIKEAAQRVPFALQDKITEMVRDVGWGNQ